VKNDYNLEELEQITVRDLRFNIMPRYKYHYMEKEYEQFSLDLIDRLVKPGSTVLDIGSHYGIYSLLSARKAGKVYAFEPVRENYEILRRNIGDNNLKNIQAFNEAISDEDGSAEFNIPWASDSAGFYEHPNAESMKKVTVKTARIDSEITAKNISFIKIDTEGHELHVLDGLQETLRNNKQATMLIELNPECLTNASSSAESLIEKIISLGYDIFALHEATRDMVRVTLDTPIPQVMRGEQYLNLLCLPVDSWLSVVVASHSSSLGGAELYLYEVISDLLAVEEKLVLPHVVVPGEGPLYGKLRALPITVQVIASQGWVVEDGMVREDRDKIDALNVDALSSLTTIMRDFQPHVVMTNTLVLPWAAIAAKMFGIPHLWAIHEFGDKDHHFRFSEGYESTLRIVGDLSENVLVTSDAVYTHIEKYIPAKKLGKMKHQIAMPAVSKKRPKVFSASAQLKLAVSGRIGSNKGQLEAVQALVALRQAGYKAELLLLGAVGSPEYLHDIKSVVKEHHVNDFVHIVDHVDNPGDYISQIDIYLMCSINEAFGRVTVESMLLGKPVVGTNSGGTPHIIMDGKTGYLYKTGDIEDLVTKIRKLADKPAMLQKFGQAGHDIAIKSYGISDRTFWYRQILETSAARPRYSSLLASIGNGLACLQQQHKDQINGIVNTHRKEIKEFSDSYNAVYAAYHKLEKRAQSHHPVVIARKLADKATRRFRNK
jgi:FkbM family methyltransferase